LNLKDPESMNAIIGNVLRYGVVISAAVTLIGTILLLTGNGLTESASLTNYNPNQIPHDGIDVSLQGLASGVSGLNPYSWIELGVILLIATPVSRVLISTFLFSAEGDRLYVLITSVVLVLLLFSMLVTPFIPGFHA
jgi:uncharacterized membrane protein